jgi:hypothetical protein
MTIAYVCQRLMLPSVAFRGTKRHWAAQSDTNNPSRKGPSGRVTTAGRG